MITYLLFCFTNLIIIAIFNYIKYKKESGLTIKAGDMFLALVVILTSCGGTALIMFLMLLYMIAVAVEWFVATEDKILIKFEKKDKS